MELKDFELNRNYESKDCPKTTDWPQYHRTTGDGYCGKRSPLVEWYCTLEKGHDGSHVAHAGDVIVAKWSYEDIPASEWDAKQITGLKEDNA